MRLKNRLFGLASSALLAIAVLSPEASANRNEEVEVKPSSTPMDPEVVPWFGGPGGTYSRLVCPWIFGMKGASGTYIDSLAFRCMSGTTTELVTAAAGGYGGAAFSDRCPNDYYATGIWGRAGTYVDFFGLICRDLKTSSDIYELAPRGGSGGAPFRYECPKNKHLGGLAIHSGNYLDSIQPVCLDD